MNDIEKVKHLFDGWEETILWSCLQGVMGAVYISREEHLEENQKEPRSAIAVLGDFEFLAGEPSGELLLNRPGVRLLIPQHKGWEILIETVYGARAEKITRYAIKKESGVWDEAGRKKLERMAADLPEGYVMRLIDRELYEQCWQQDWSRDLVSQFETYELYEKLGLGAAALYKNELVCGASSYSRFLNMPPVKPEIRSVFCAGGIEIEIDTKEDYRRRGLARACAARLILECLNRGLYPSWDAHTEISARLAESLGYHRGEAYTAYAVREM